MEFIILVCIIIVSIVNLIVEVFTILKRRKLIEKIESKGNKVIHICRKEDRGRGIFMLVIVVLNIITAISIDTVRNNLLLSEWIMTITTIVLIIVAMIIRMTLKGIIYDEGILTGRNKFISWVEISEVYCRLSMLDTFYEVELTNKEGKKFELQVKKKDIEKVSEIIGERSNGSIKYSKIVLE